MRKLRLVILSFAVCIFAVSAEADSVPIFNVKQGTALVTPSAFVIGNLAFGFSGSGFSLNGNGSVTGSCGFCVSNAPPGLSGLTGSNEISNSGANIGQVTLGAVVFNNVFFQGIVSITGSKTFSLPTGSQPSFTITLPIKFSGQLLACQAALDSNGCASPEIDIAAFNFQNLKGRVKIDFPNFDNSYSYERALYTLTPVPEPGTIG